MFRHGLFHDLLWDFHFHLIIGYHSDELVFCFFLSLYISYYSHMSVRCPYNIYSTLKKTLHSSIPTSKAVKMEDGRMRHPVSWC